MFDLNIDDQPYEDIQLDRQMTKKEVGQQNSKWSKLTAKNIMMKQKPNFLVMMAFNLKKKSKANSELERKSIPVDSNAPQYNF